MTVEALQVIQDLAVVLLASLVMALIFRRLGLPLLVGYIIAGIILGPYTPPFSLLLHPDILDLFAQIGIVFLLLGVGLEYPVARLRAVGRPALLIALSEAAATFIAGWAVGRLLGLSEFNSLFLGLAISVTSTIILAAVLEEMGVLREKAAGLILGVTIVEDVFAVSVLGLLESVASSGRVSWFGVAIAVLVVVAFIGVVLLAGSRIIPGLVDAVARSQRKDLLLLTVLGLAFGLSILSSLAGLSVATGAFLAGVLVADSASQPTAKELVTPVRDLFAAVFFVSIGALMDFALLPPLILLVVALLVVALVLKFVVTFVATRSQGFGVETARRTAAAIAGPRGELSLVVAQGGADVGATSAFVLPTIGAITLATSVLTPFLLRAAWRKKEGESVLANPAGAAESADRLEPST